MNFTSFFKSGCELTHWLCYKVFWQTTVASSRINLVHPFSHLFNKYLPSAISVLKASITENKTDRALLSRAYILTVEQTLDKWTHIHLSTVVTVGSCQSARESPPLAKMAQGDVLIPSAPKARKMNGQGPSMPKTRNMNGWGLNVMKASKIIRQKKSPPLPL